MVISKDATLVMRHSKIRLTMGLHLLRLALAVLWARFGLMPSNNATYGTTTLVTACPRKRVLKLRVIF